MSATRFLLRTHHGTRLVADPLTGRLRHDLATNGVDIVALPFGEQMCFLIRRDGGPISATADGAHAGPLLSCRIASDEGGVTLRIPPGGLLTPLPGGEVAVDRDTIGQWERFKLEADGEEAHPSWSIPSLPPGDPAAIKTLANRLAKADPPARRRALLSLADRPDIVPIFVALRRLLSGGPDRSRWHTRDHLAAGIETHGWQVGDHTYGNPAVIDGEYAPLAIGRYCSIAGGVTIVVSNHAIDTVTTYPFAALASFWPSASDLGGSDHVGSGVSIGHGVWIGQGVTFLPGAAIGDGAIIGAGAVVAGPVPPFAVVVGNPVRVLRIRFAAPIVERLLAVAWWNWPDERVDRFIPLLLGRDIEAFLEAAEGGVAPFTPTGSGAPGPA